MQFKDVNLKNFHTLPLAGIAFYRVIPCTATEPTHSILLESIDAEMISILIVRAVQMQCIKNMRMTLL